MLRRFLILFFITLLNFTQQGFSMSMPPTSNIELLQNIVKEKFNVLTVTRRVKEVEQYDIIGKEQIGLIFANLARCVHGDTDSEITKKLNEYLQSNIPESNWKKKMKSEIMGLYEQSAPALISGELTFTPIKDKKTIILFNETFFGQESPFTKMEVQNIIDCYRYFKDFLKNIFVFINFLYTENFDANDKKQQKMIEIAKQQYNGMSVNQKYGRIVFEKKDFPVYNKTYADAAKDFNNDSEFFDALGKEHPILLNQTKILYNGEEIAFYNKSSYFHENDPSFYLDSDFKTPIKQEETNPFKDEEERPAPFYAIGDFKTHKSSDNCEDVQNILMATCSDIDCFENGFYEQFNKDTYNMFMFPANGHLMPVKYVKYIYDKLYVKCFICAEPLGYCIKVPKKMGFTRDPEGWSSKYNDNNGFTGVFKVINENDFCLENFKLLNFECGDETLRNKYEIRIFDTACN